MARIATTNLSLGTWAEGENPGAGSQTVQDNAGLNHNWLKLDAVIGAEHGSAGTHNNDVIGGASIKNTIVDGTTLVASASTGAKTFGVATGGIGSTQLASGAVTSGKLGTGAVDATALASNAVTEAKINAAAVTNTKLGDDAVTSAKISHDNTRTKVCFVFTVVTDAQQYAYIGNVQCTATYGLPMPRAGSITKHSVCNNGGVVVSATSTYGTTTFAAGDKIQLYMNQAAADTMQVKINDTTKSALSLESSGSGNWISTIEVEFDD